MAHAKYKKSRAVFNYIFEKSEREGVFLSPMKAIKLVYFCHAWYLGFESEPLLDEPIEAWKYGAVIPSLYQDLKIYGAGEIKYPILEEQEKHYIDIYLNNDKVIRKAKKTPTNDLTERERKVIDMVWNGYKSLSASQLSGIMHQDGTPWSQVWKNGTCLRNSIIPNEMIEEYYQQRINSASHE